MGRQIPASYSTSFPESHGIFFTYLTIDNYKEFEFPDDSYLKKDGQITMNIDDNRITY